MFKKILIVLAILIAGILALATTQPDDFKVTRTATIDAAPSAVFPHVNNLHKWQEWSPWAKMDPQAKTEFTGPVAGKGAAMSWDGNFSVGKGTMTISNSKPNTLIAFNLDFQKPMKANNTAEFTFKEEKKGQTTVTWTMMGKNNYMGKVIGLIMNCEKMVGTQFENGLADLKAIVETKPKK